MLSLLYFINLFPSTTTMVAITFFLLFLLAQGSLTDAKHHGTHKHNQVKARATCILEGVANGRLLLEQYVNFTKITGFVTNLIPGKHGFHIHKYGDLTNGCASTGGHYNPLGKTHGAPKDTHRHIGDLGNIKVGKLRWARVYIRDRRVKLLGRFGVIGRAIVVHQGVDDLGKGGNKGSLTTGNAGRRMGCCVIGHAKTK